MNLTTNDEYEYRKKVVRIVYNDKLNRMTKVRMNFKHEYVFFCIAFKTNIVKKVYKFIQCWRDID